MVSYLAGSFVEGKALWKGKVQGRFVLIFEVLNRFIERTAPTLEAVHARLDILEKKPFGSIEGDELEGELRADVQAAEKELTNYNRTFGQIDHHLAMMSSNFNLPQFLSKNGVPAKDISFVQKEVAEYWNDTYGVLTKKVNVMHTHMEKMKNLLEQQIGMLREVPSRSFFVGFSESSLIRKLFRQERVTFWKLVKSVKISEKEIKNVQNIFAAERKHAKETIKAHLKLLKKSVKADIEAHESKVMKSLVVVTYLLGALDTMTRIKSVIIEEGVKAAMGRMMARRKEKVLSQVGTRMEVGMELMVAMQTEKGLMALAKVL